MGFSWAMLVSGRVNLNCFVFFSGGMGGVFPDPKAPSVSFLRVHMILKAGCFGGG